MSKKVAITCAAVLSAAFLGLALADNSRPWKRLQLDFFELERRQLTERLEAARAEAGEAVASLEAEVEAEETAFAGRRAEVAKVEKELRGFRGKEVTAKLRRHRLEARIQALGDLAAAELTEERRQTRIELESLAELVADREHKLELLRAELDAARERLAAARAPIDLLERRLAAVPAPPILHLGGLLAPGVDVREVSPVAGRVDRCATSQLAAARDDLETQGWPAPFRRHPRPELFAAADSPHPYARFGCVSCHGGDGRATDFERAGHPPPPAVPAWQAPRPAMLPLELTEAACGGCHGAEVFTPEAPVLGRGRQLIAALGCTGCHASDHPALRGLPKAGPSLAGIAGKTTPAWVYAQLTEEGAAPAQARVPHVLDPDGGAGADRSAEARAVVEVLWQAARPATHQPPPEGDAEAGRALFETVGCRGCHRLGAETEPAPPPDPAHGPDLAGIGSKADAAWLHAWLLDPRAVNPGTSMPSLRLDGDEAADLTAYLTSLRDPAWETPNLPDVDVEARDRLVLAALAAAGTLEESEDRLEGMSEREKQLFLGEQTITEHACHGCHQIAGFENAVPAGESMREVGRRLRERLARGEIDAPGWWTLSHRPVYNLSGAEAGAVTVAVLGFSEAPAPLSDQRLASLARGRRIVARYNCRGCHRIEGRGGEEMAGESADGAPPDLVDAGARLKASWIHDYLADPGRWQVRPWLQVRMPSFGLSEDELDALARYFAALDERPLFAAEPVSADVDVAVGRVIYGMLQCEDCHAAANGEPNPGPAPDYALAAQRLRADWTVDWILDPERWRPGTSMPVNFLPIDGGEPASDYLIGSIDAPMFNVEGARLLQALGSDQALRAYLSDPRRVASALREYLWTLEE